MNSSKVIRRRPDEKIKFFRLREQLGLSLDIQTLSESEYYKNSLPLQALNKEIRGISTLQRHVGNLASIWRNRAGWIWFLFFNGTILLLILIIGIMSIIDVVSPGFAPLIPLLGITPLAAAPPLLILRILFSRKEKFYKSLSFKKLGRDTYNRYNILKALLQSLEKDNTKKKPLSLLLDFSKQEKSGKLLWVRGHPRHPEREVKRYQDPFLELKGRLVDGSVYRLRLRENIETIEWRNEHNNPRFRVKHKGYDLCLKLTPNPRCYAPQAELVGKATPAVKLPPACHLKSMAWQYGQLIIRVKLMPQAQESQRGMSFQPVEGIQQTVMMTLLSAYQILNLTHQQKRAA